MLVADPKGCERLVLGAEKSPRVYFLKVPTVGERTRYRRAVALAGGRRHSAFALLDALSAAVKDSLDAAAAEFLLAAIETHRAALTALAEFAREFPDGESVSPEDRAQWAVLAAEAARSERALIPVIEAVRAGDARYAAMETDNSQYFGIAGAEAARLLLKGWEGIAAPLSFARDGLLTEACLAAIPERDLAELGAFAEGLMNLSERQRKNFSSPSATPSDGPISNATNTATNGARPNSALPGSANTLPI